MTKIPQREFTGPIEEQEWPDKLRANVVTPGPDPKIHGYSVEGDLAVHYSFAESLFLTLTGELPVGPVGPAFDAILQYLSPVSVAEAPAHAAVLARMSGARDSGCTGVGAISLAEQARFILNDHADLIESIGTESPVLDRRFQAPDETDSRSARAVRARLAQLGLELPALLKDASRTATLICALRACGLRQRWQFEAVFTVSRLPCVIAEAAAAVPGDFRSYPMDTPVFVYEEK